MCLPVKSTVLLHCDCNSHLSWTEEDDGWITTVVLRDSCYGDRESDPEGFSNLTGGWGPWVLVPHVPTFYPSLVPSVRAGEVLSRSSWVRSPTGQARGTTVPGETRGEGAPIPPRPGTSVRRGPWVPLPSPTVHPRIWDLPSPDARPDRLVSTSSLTQVHSYHRPSGPVPLVPWPRHRGSALVPVHETHSLVATRGDD